MAKKSPYFGSNYLPVVSVVFALWVALYSLVLFYVAEISMYKAIGESLVFSGIICGFSYILLTSLQFYQPSTKRYFFFPSVVFIASLIAVAFTQLLAHLKDPISPINWIFYKTFWLDFIVAIIIIGFVTAISMLWYQVLDQQAIENRQKEMEKLAKDAELFQLRHQMQPHFLFNSLNSINALITLNSVQAREMVTNLSSFLRHSIKADDRVLVTLKDEVEHLKLYLDIEKVRFGHRLSTLISVDETVEQFLLPPLLLQPLLENAIKFGLYGTTENVVIELLASEKDGNLLISISNPVDEDVDAQSGSKFGLSAVKRRLYLVYERNDLLETKTANQQFLAQIKIPQKQ